MTSRGFSLTTKIFVGTALIVVAVLVVTLTVTARSAGRAASAAVNKALTATRAQTATQLQERARSLAGKAEIFVKDPNFRSFVGQKKVADVYDQARESVQRIGADWVQITDDAGVRLAKSDDPSAASDTLAGSALISGALEGHITRGYGITGDSVLFEAVAVPIEGTSSRVVGALMAVRAVDSAFAASVRDVAGGSDIAFFAIDANGAPRPVASTLGRSAELAAFIRSLPKATPRDPAMADSTPAPIMRMEPNIAGTHYVAIGEPLYSASGNPVGGFVVLSNRDAEFRDFNHLRTIIIIGGLLGLIVAGLLSLVIARQITRPVAQLVAATRRAAEGDYAADIDVKADGEIGTLADAFRAMLHDLRDKQALVEFLGGNTPGDARTVRMSVALGATTANMVQQGGITPGTRFAQRYEVKEVLGVGGMGTVFKAVDSDLGEIIAIKTLKQDLLSQDDTALERFKSEIRLARRISHRNVVRTHDLGEFGGVYYITMEYVEGKSLKDLIRTRGRLPVAVTLTIAKQLCRALEVAHEQGVIHRDIKPQNMVVEPDGVLKVMDFGIARLATRQSGVTQAGMVVGTPEYMAPEQLMGDDIDARADIYAAGCVIYECLTGSPPITADSQITLIAKLLEDTPIPPRVVNAEVPEALSELVMRTLAKKAADRPQTATELHDLLAQIG